MSTLNKEEKNDTLITSIEESLQNKEYKNTLYSLKVHPSYKGFLGKGFCHKSKLQPLIDFIKSYTTVFPDFFYERELLKPIEKILDDIVVFITNLIHLDSLVSVKDTLYQLSNTEEENNMFRSIHEKITEVTKNVMSTKNDDTAENINEHSLLNNQMKVYDGINNIVEAFVKIIEQRYNNEKEFAFNIEFWSDINEQLKNLLQVYFVNEW